MIQGDVGFELLIGQLDVGARYSPEPDPKLA